MKHEQFRLGGPFYTASGAWVCTDIGTRTIIAVRKAQLDKHPDGPPYSIAETSFDEYDHEVCFKTEAQAKDQLGLTELKGGDDDEPPRVITAPVAPHVVGFLADARRAGARSRPRAKRRAPKVK